MAEDNKQEMVEFEFPDETENKAEAVKEEKVAKGKPEADIEIEDDTPEQDRNKEPMPKEIVKELEKIEEDELEQYSEKVQQRLKQMKKVWHDERREKERALREQQEALALAKRLADENRKLQANLSDGEDKYLDVAKEAAERNLEVARRAYKEAYESGDADRIIEAQEKLNNAQYRSEQLSNYKPQYKKALQDKETPVNSEPQQAQVARPDSKAVAWQERNTWFGQDEEMTSTALGLHQKLVKSGVDPTSDDYYQRIDSTMRKRFPEYFGEPEEEVSTQSGGGKPVERTKSSTVVAPATRSTSAKKIKLTTTQVSIAKKLGLTPEQYARELLKMEARNG